MNQDSTRRAAGRSANESVMTVDSTKGRELLIVDNSVSGWTGPRYLEGAAIPDAAWCLFRTPVEGTRQGKIVLVQLRDATNPETGQRYTVKRYKSQEAQEGDSWRHGKITLEPVNPDFEPIALTGADEDELQVVAEPVEVLQPNAFSAETDSR